jgi:hypothetical protein
VLTSAPTDAKVLAQFHARGGYQRPQEDVDSAFYGRMLAEDEAALAR